MSKKLKTIISLIVCIAAAAVVLIVGIKYLSPQDVQAPEEKNTAVTAPTGLIINEVVTSSRYSLVAADGSAPDWIELYNGSSSAVSLSGLTLSDDPKNTAKFAFPNVSIKSGAYLVILCDGNETSEDNQIHANFRLSSKGDFIGIFSGSNVIHSLEIPALGKDISYGRTTDGTYRYLCNTTAGAENTGFFSDSADFSDLAGTFLPSVLAINEYQVDNLNTLMDKDGEHGEWVEVKNMSSEAISLADYGLSDNAANIGKWSFPDLTLEAGACRTVFLSGKRSSENELHTSFRLSKDDSVLILSQKGTGIVDLVAVDHSLPQNCSYGRKPEDGTWAYFPSPTPGADNLSKSFARLDISDEKYLP